MSIRGRVVHTFIRMRVRVLSAHNAATGRYPEPLCPSPIRRRNPPQHVHSACATHTIVYFSRACTKTCGNVAKDARAETTSVVLSNSPARQETAPFLAPQATWQKIGPGWPMCYTEGPGQHKPGNSGGAPRPAMFPHCATMLPAAHL